MTDDHQNTDKLEVLYDGQCPICQQFAKQLQEDENIQMVDGRASSPLKNQALNNNLDINKGFVVRHQEKIYHEKEAFHLLANKSQPRGLLRYANLMLFRHKIISALLYPIMVKIRRLLLFILRRPPIPTSSPTPKKANTDSTALQVLYNSACPVCEFGVNHQKEKMESCAVDWVDIHQNIQAAKDINENTEFVRKRLHVIDKNHQLHVGIDAVIAIWRESPRELWKAKLVSLPVIHWLTHHCYNLFAWTLYKTNRFRKRW